MLLVFIGNGFVKVICGVQLSVDREYLFGADTPGVEGVSDVFYPPYLLFLSVLVSLGYGPVTLPDANICEKLRNMNPAGSGMIS